MAVTVREASDLTSKFARVTIMGEAGAGKTYLCRTLPDLTKTVFINTKGYEDGDIVLSDLKGLTILDLDTIRDFPVLIDMLKNDPAFKDKEFIFFDSLTGLSGMSIKYWETQHPDRKGKQVFDLYRDHGEGLRNAFLELKKLNKHVFLTALLKESNDKVAAGILVPKVDGAMFEESLRAWSDGTLALKSYEDGTRKLLLQNNGIYACKLRTPGNKKTPLVLEEPEQVNLTYVLKLMGFDYTKKTEGVKQHGNRNK